MNNLCTHILVCEILHSLCSSPKIIFFPAFSEFFVKNVNKLLRGDASSAFINLKDHNFYSSHTTLRHLIFIVFLQLKIFHFCIFLKKKKIFCL